jgi:O-antigen ligase
VLTNPTTDASVKERIAQYAAAWSLFATSPIVGVGPGHAIEWIDISGNRRSAYTADTPLVMAAKFGILGIAVFAGFAAAYVRTARDALRLDRRSTVSLALVGFATVAIVSLPLGFLVEDKGTSLALILLLALAFGEATAPGADDVPSRQPGG